MGFHTFDPERAEQLEAPSRYRWCSREELLTAVAPTEDDVLADLGSGTGFYTDEVAPHVDTLYAIDVQTEMHDLYREKGLPTSVEPITAPIEDLPLGDDSLDGAFSTMTYHEFASAEAFAELRRVLRPGGRLVIVDWTSTGERVTGPPLDERYHVGEAARALTDAGFAVERAEERGETFVCLVRG